MIDPAKPFSPAGKQSLEKFLRRAKCPKKTNDNGVVVSEDPACQASDKLAELLHGRLNTKKIQEGLALICKHGADPNENTPTFVHAAAAIGDIDAIIKASKAGADVNTTTSYHKQTILVSILLNQDLTWSVAKKVSALLKLINQAGANPNIRSEAGLSPLIILARNGAYDQALRLIKGSRTTAVNLKMPDSMGKTILHYTAEHNKWGVVAELIKLGANPLVRDNQEHDIFDIAVSHDASSHKAKTLSSLLRLLPDEMVAYIKTRQNRVGETLVHGAVRGGDIDEAIELIKLGFDPNTPNYDGKTPLVLALEAKDYDGFMKLVAAGATITPEISRVLDQQRLNPTVKLRNPEETNSPSEDPMAGLLKYLQNLLGLPG